MNLVYNTEYKQYIFLLNQKKAKQNHFLKVSLTKMI